MAVSGTLIKPEYCKPKEGALMESDTTKSCAVNMLSGFALFNAELVLKNSL